MLQVHISQLKAMTKQKQQLEVQNDTEESDPRQPGHEPSNISMAQHIIR